MFLIELLGGLAITVLGIKFMSESLEKTAGDRVKTIMSRLTSNHYSSVFAGMAVSLIIHSSSATSALAVSFVNSGMFSSLMALGIILGAGIGSSVSPWIISISRLGIDITHIAFIVLFLGLILLYMKNEKAAIAAYICIGFAFIFTGMWIMKLSLTSHELPVNLYFDLVAGSPVIFYLFACILIILGAVSTFMLRNSLATIALFIVAVNQGIMDTRAGFYVILGCNLGRALILLFTGRRGNIHARKIAAAFGILSVTGIAFFMVPPVLNTFTRLSVAIAYLLPLELYMHAFAGLPLAVFNSLYNITITLLSIMFLPYYIKVIDRFFNHKTDNYSLIHLNTGLIKTPDLALIEVQDRVIKMAGKSYKMFKRTFDLFFIKKSMYKSYLTEMKSIREEIKIHDEDIHSFLIELSQGSISSGAAAKIDNFFEKIKNLKWISENCWTLGKLLSKGAENKYSLFNKPNEEQFNTMLQNLDLFYSLIINNLAHMSVEKIKEEGLMYEKSINLAYKKLRNITIARMGRDRKKRDKTIRGGLLFMEIIKTIELIGDSLENILYLYIYTE